MTKSRVPLYSLAALVTFVIAATLLLLFAQPDNENVTLFIGLIVATLPALVASFAAERASNDIRNGVVEEKARIGATKALDDTGVTEAVKVSNYGESTALAMQTLAKLLELNTAASEANTASRKEP